MSAHAGIVTAKSMAEVSVALHVVEFDAMPAVVQRWRDLAAEKRRRPPAVMRFQQQLVIAGVLRQGHQFAGPVARQCGLAPEIGVDPQTPFGLEKSRAVAEFLADLAGPA